MITKIIAVFQQTAEGTLVAKTDIYVEQFPCQHKISNRSSAKHVLDVFMLVGIIQKPSHHKKGNFHNTLW
jgi:hypothetical protein